MSEKLEIRIVANSDGYPENWNQALCYGGDQLTPPFRGNSRRFNLCTGLVSDFATMQSEIEALRAKDRAFDWFQANYNDLNLDISYDPTMDTWDIWIPGESGSDNIGCGQTLQFAIEDFIAKHETDEIPDKGDTMNTSPPSKMKLETQNVLEIRSVTENEIALFFDGERCSGDHHPSGAFGQIYLKLADYVASLESRLAELEELAEMVEFAGSKQITISNNPVSGWTAWYWDDDDAKPDPRFPHKGDTFVAAVAVAADYHDKHPEPKEDTSVIMAKYIIEMYDNEESLSHYWHARLVKMAHKILAREKGK